MKAIWILLALMLAGCASTRVQVRHCEAIAGTGDHNCELVRELN